MPIVSNKGEKLLFEMDEEIDHNLNARMMSPEQILNQKLIEPSMLNYGLKKRFPDETSNEIVDRLQDDLLKVISYERVERTISRSQAEYNAITGLVVVTRKLGKWNTIGYRTNNLDCLRYYEALHLIDTNRLELYYDSVLVSLEQAYALLLNNPRDEKCHEKYFIYSNLSKTGYNVQPHREHVEVNQRASSAIQFSWSKEITPADKCVWRCLFEDLKQPASSKDISEEVDELYLNIRQNMKNIEDAIKSQQSHSITDIACDIESNNWQSVLAMIKDREESPKKRKLETSSFPSTSRKISKLECTTDRFLDVLTYEQEVCTFRKLFEDVQVIQLAPTYCDNFEDSSSDVKFDFDLYLALPNFKQSDPGIPNFRILIVKSNERPPTREAIVKAFLRPAVPVPVLVLYVNELMRVSAFLYRISI